MYLCINQCIDGEGGHNSEELPFACYLCRSDFINPIITLCGHYYCSNCISSYVKGGDSSNHKSKGSKGASKEGSKSSSKGDKTSGSSGSNSKCPICDKQMYGVFNRGTKLIKKLQSTTSTTATTTASTSTTAGGSSVSSSKRPKSSFVFIDE